MVGMMHFVWTVSQNDTASACYNFDLHQPIAYILVTFLLKMIKIGWRTSKL